MTSDEKSKKEATLAKYYTPGTPISMKEFLAGRTDQLRRVLDVINQLGQHAIIYGERGVGKTSLANIITRLVELANVEEKHQLFATRVNCDRSDTFASVWKKVFSRLSQLSHSTDDKHEDSRIENPSLSTSFNERTSPSDVANILNQLPSSIIVLDEFDRLSDERITTLFSDCIKAISDFEVHATIVIVGVADNISQLISEHASIERCITQIHLPRMSYKELEAIMTTRYPLAEMTYDNDVPKTIAKLSQGFPHYVHLLGLDAGRAALDRDSSHVTKEDIKIAIKKAIQNTGASIQEAYITAIRSSHKESLYEQVLLACALAEPDQFGYFSPPDVREPMSTIMKRKYDIPAFAGHLAKFCEEGRGGILERKGSKHRYKYRFSNPLVRPYIYLRGIDTGKAPQKYFPL
jgi:Cdc6-like AAA superfamily ATPase